MINDNFFNVLYECIFICVFNLNKEILFIELYEILKVVV